ncbi:MAG: hypothetical protein FJY29_09770 [Betaproteobacteria bacterium]|nr:hypothetical protein [Betaproteobacteria bacterium]
MKNLSTVLLATVSLIGLPHCSSSESKSPTNGGNSASSSDPGEGGVSPVDLSAYCTATITKDFTVKFLSKDWYTVKSGEKLAIVGRVIGSEAELIRFTKDGKAYEVDDVPSENFTSDCGQNTTGDLEIVALTSVELFSDVQLSNKLCTVNAGASYKSNSYGFGSNGGEVYEIFADVLVSACNSSTGKVFAGFPRISVGNTNIGSKVFAWLRRKN